MSPSLRIELFPDDIGPTINFYTRILGFCVLRHEPEFSSCTDPKSPNTVDRGYTYLSNGSINIGFNGTPPAGSQAVQKEYRRPPTGVEIVIEVDDLPATRERFSNAQWPIKEDIKLQPWKLRDFRVEDPSGYYLRITEKSKKGDASGE